MRSTFDVGVRLNSHCAQPRFGHCVAVILSVKRGRLHSTAGASQPRIEICRTHTLVQTAALAVYRMVRTERACGETEDACTRGGEMMEWM